MQSHYLRQHSLDGLDLHWLYPAQRGSPADDRWKFTPLCKELKEAFKDEAASYSANRLLLTAAVAAKKSSIDASYERDKLGL